MCVLVIKDAFTEFYADLINIDDIMPGKYLSVTVVKGDFSNGDIDGYMSDAEVKTIIESLTFSK